MNDPGNCGACGFACQAQHSEAACGAGRCTHTACEAGWFDCDFDPGNGCETLGQSCVTSLCLGFDQFGDQVSCAFWGISDDGTRLLFTSPSAFFSDDLAFTDDAFLYETRTGTLQWLTRPRDGGEIAQRIQAAAISGDGTRVAFTVYGDLVAPDNNGQPDLYLLDLTTGVLTYAPRPTDAGDIGAPLQLVLSRSGRYVSSFVQGGVVGAGVIWSDLLTGNSKIVPSFAPGVGMSGDGLKVSLVGVNDAGAALPFVLDTQDGGLTPISFSDAGTVRFGEFNAMAFDYAGDRFAVQYSTNSFSGDVWVETPGRPFSLHDGGFFFQGSPASLSSDGRLVALGEVSPTTGASQCSVIDLATGNHLGLSVQPGFCAPQLSGDGRTLVVTQSSQLGGIALLRVNRP
jgi:hypothetical protein